MTIGIPAALYMFDELPLWKKFFELLSIKTLSSEEYKEAVNAGKELRGAEFCTPVTAMYGHITYLLENTDYIFLPFYLEEKKKNDAKRNIVLLRTQYVRTLVDQFTDVRYSRSSQFVDRKTKLVSNPDL